MSNHLYTMKLLQPSLIQHNFYHTRNNVSASWKLSEMVDINCGVNLSGINAIREIEDSNNGRKLQWSALSGW
jgi:hypothetical protein